MAVISNVFASFLEVVDEVIKAKVKNCVVFVLHRVCLRPGPWQSCFFPLEVPESGRVSVFSKTHKQDQRRVKFKPQTALASDVKPVSFPAWGSGRVSPSERGMASGGKWTRIRGWYFTGTAFPDLDRQAGAVCISKGKAT